MKKQTVKSATTDKTFDPQGTIVSIRNFQGDRDAVVALGDDAETTIAKWFEYIDGEVSKFWNPSRFSAFDREFLTPAIPLENGEVKTEGLHGIFFAIGGDDFKKRVGDYIRKNSPEKSVKPSEKKARLASLDKEILKLWVDLERGARAMEAIGGFFDRPGDLPPEVFLARDLDAVIK